MKITHAKNIPPMPNPHGLQAGIIYDTQHAQAVHLTLKAGEKLKPHITPVDVFFYVLEGEPLIEIGGEKVKVTADHIVESPAGTPHCIYNDENDSIARVLVVKVPQPTRPTKML